MRVLVMPGLVGVAGFHRRDDMHQAGTVAADDKPWDEQVAPRYRSDEPAPGMIRERFLRMLDAACRCRSMSKCRSIEESRFPLARRHVGRHHNVTRRGRRSAAAGESLRHFGRGQTCGTTRPSVRSPRRA